MPNKVRGAELWSETLQTSVTPEVNDKINEMAVKSGTSRSNVVRLLLDRALSD